MRLINRGAVFGTGAPRWAGGGGIGASMGPTPAIWADKSSALNAGPGFMGAEIIPRIASARLPAAQEREGGFAVAGRAVLIERQEALERAHRLGPLSESVLRARLGDHDAAEARLEGDGLVEAHDRGLVM